MERPLDYVAKTGSPSIDRGAQNDLAKHYHKGWLQREMLGDERRTRAFEHALAALAPGKTVMDFGCGYGILAMMAAAHGASKVYAFELTESAHVARRLVFENGLADRVEVIMGDASQAELPGPVDIIVSEWMGGFGVDENFIRPLIAARDRLLAPTGIMIPAKARGYAALAFDTRLHRLMNLWHGKPYAGLDLSTIGQLHAHSVLNARHWVTDKSLRSEPWPLYSLDMLTCSPDDGDLCLDVVVHVDRGGQTNCIAAWFDVEMGHGHSLSNAPHLPDSHWGRTVMPLGATLNLPANTEVHIHFESKGEEILKAVQTWEVSIPSIDFHTRLNSTQDCVHSEGFH